MVVARSVQQNTVVVYSLSRPTDLNRSMQLFGLSRDARVAARMLCDSHVLKMVIEITQILYTALYYNKCKWLGTPVRVPRACACSKRKRDKEAANSDDVSCNEFVYESAYKPTHSKHPCVLWTRACDVHFEWTLKHGLALAAEYARRFEKTHKCSYHLAHIEEHWRAQGWMSEDRKIPAIITANEWIQWQKDEFNAGYIKAKTIDENCHRIACINPPEGCLFGVVCMDEEHRASGVSCNMTETNDWTASYEKFYNYKKTHAFKRPMRWSKSSVQTSGVGALSSASTDTI